MSDLPQMPETLPAAAAPAVSAEAPQVSETIDIDGVTKFTFQGEEYNPEKLHKILGEWKSNSEKVTSYEKELQYANNLQIDLDNVLNDPRLAEKFKTTYPQKYHAILDKYLSSNGQSLAPSNAQPPLPKEILDRMAKTDERLSFFEQQAYSAAVESAQAKLDSLLPSLFQKYELADEDAVLARAEAALNRKEKLTDKTWERFARESHEKMQKKADQHYGAKLKSQIEKGKQAQDMGPGGATPGSAPKKARTFDEAREQMIASLSRQK